MMVVFQPLASRADGIGRAIMGLCAAAALFAFVSGITSSVSPQLGWLTLWQSWGFAMFAGLFALLALRSRLSPGLWELAFFHKLVLAISGFLSPTLPGAADAGLFDAGLAAAIGLSYWLTKAWRGWQAVQS